MSKRKTERLLGLVVCLLSTRRYLTAEQIREAVPGYPEQDDLFKRMFERDKEDLRELGVPLETGVNHPFDDDPGYRIRQQAYERPELEPWGVVNRHGRWYVVGWDRGRNATRVFRLGRIAGPVKFCGPPGRVTVPDGADVRELVRDWDSAPAQERTALLRVRTGAGVGLRRHAVSVQADDSRPGWDQLTTRFADVGWFADYAASFGPDAVVLDPPDLREAVIR